ncbi:MAG: MlaD family protein [Rhodospirillales bacterium]|nr:MlaD family protein [Rhodospirillales bacterium]
MKHNPTRDIWVGASAVVALAGLFAFSYAGKQMSAEASVGAYPVVATFNRVDGLFEGDAVQLSGIRVGTVGAQHLDDNFRAVVTLNINSSTSLPVDSAVAIHTDGLFGSKSVVLEPGVEDKMLKAGDTIQYTQGAVVVGELLNLIIEEGRARRAKTNDATGNDTTNQTQEGNN